MVKLISSLLLFLAFGLNAQAECDPSFSTSVGEVHGKEGCQFNKNLYVNSEITLTKDKVWLLKGGVFIGGDNKDSSTITIEPGTKIVGERGDDFLSISRGSKIFAKGTKNEPIIFTSAKETNRKRGEWGGLILNGNAPINGCLIEDGKADQGSCTDTGEGQTGNYGGNNPEDSSGVLEYVRVEFAGFEISTDNELNGISFYGVGSGTTVNHIQVHMNADDGVEFYGGTVNVKNVLLTGIRDDSLDWTYGWVGKAQFVIIHQYDDEGNNGIEADNRESKMNSIPRSNPILSNLTMIGTSAEGPKGGEGILLRHGTAAEIYNTVVTGFKKSCFDMDSKETFEVAGNNTVMENVYLSCDKNIKINDEDGFSDLFNLDTWFLEEQFGNKMVADLKMNKWVPQAGSPLLENGEAPIDTELFFDEVDFIGAVRDADSDWTQGWTTDARN